MAASGGLDAGFSLLAVPLANTRKCRGSDRGRVPPPHQHQRAQHRQHRLLPALLLPFSPLGLMLERGLCVRISAP
eukprot:363887-Chlamydomonas_euryale.AAC.6